MKEQKNQSVLINEQIKAPSVQLITHDGKNMGIVSREKALAMAEEAELDLVMLAESGSEGVPVVKIMDFGKMLYEKKKKQAEAKKHQKVIQVKEIKMRPKIGEHDFQTKIKHAIEFLKEGKRVKFTVMFRGRESMQRDELGTTLFEKIEKVMTDHGIEHLMHEKDTRAGMAWSRIYFIK